MTASPASTMRRDIASAYLASACKIGSWVVVSALVYRVLGPGAFAVLALIRGTIGLLNYISLGLAPALIHQASEAGAAVQNEPYAQQPVSGPTLPYYTQPRPATSLQSLYSNGLLITYAGGVAGLILASQFATSFDRLLRVPIYLQDLPFVVLLMGFGTLLRLMGDAPGAVLQVRSRIALDNGIIASGESTWAVLSVLTCVVCRSPDEGLVFTALWYAVSGAMVFLARLYSAGRATGIYKPQLKLVDVRIVGQLVAFGVMVVLAQLADYLYAPTDYILIDRLLQLYDIANYAPAVQIDAGLLLLVTGLAAVMLPKAALAHAGGDAKTVRQYYIVGTVASLGLLAVASVVVWVLSPWLFRLWLGNSMPATRSILPLVLANTVIGGSSTIGRSILLAVGRVRPFTVAVLIAGVTNVVCSYAFVRWFHMGLNGIVLGTVVAMVGRCAIWMPWYVLRTLRANEALPPAGHATLPPDGS